MKKKCLVLFSAITVSLTLLACFVDAGDFSNVKASDTCDWNHYARTEPTYQQYGNKEFWICCTHHDYSLVKPTSGKGTDKEAATLTQEQFQSIETRKSELNSPYLPSYKTCVDEVIASIELIPSSTQIKAFDYNKITDARTKYDALDQNAKSYVTNFSKLTESETVYSLNYGLVLDLQNNNLSSNGCASSWVPTFSQSSFVDSKYGGGKSLSISTGLGAYEFAYSNANSPSNYKYIAMYVYAPIELHFFISRQNWRNNVMNVNCAPDLTGSIDSTAAIANKNDANSVQSFGLSIGWHEIIFEASRFSTSGFFEIWGTSSKHSEPTIFENWKISNIYGIKEYNDVTKINNLIASLPKNTGDVTSLTVSQIEGIDSIYNSLSSSSKTQVQGYDSFNEIRNYVDENFMDLSCAYTNGVSSHVFTQEIEGKSYIDSIGGSSSKVSIYKTLSSFEHCGIKPNQLLVDNINSFSYIAVNIYNPLDIDLNASFVNGDYGYLTNYTIKAKSWSILKETPSQFTQGIKNAYVLIYSNAPIASDDWMISSFYGYGTNPVKEIIKQIDNLPSGNSLTIESYDTLMQIKKEYDNLSSSCQALVTNYSKLNNLINIYDDDFNYISNETSYLNKGSFDYAHTKDYQASIIDDNVDKYHGRYSQINFESFEEFLTYSSADTWNYTPCLKVKYSSYTYTYNSLMFYIYNPTSVNQNIYLYKGYWVPASARYKNEADNVDSTSTNEIILKSGWTRIIIDDVSNVDFNNFVIGFCGKGKGTCESGWKITSLRGEVNHSFSNNY